MNRRLCCDIVVYVLPSSIAAETMMIMLTIIKTLPIQEVALSRMVKLPLSQLLLRNGSYHGCPDDTYQSHQEFFDLQG